MLYFFEKSSQSWGLRPQTSLASGGWGLHPQTPKLFLLLNLRITFERCSDFSVSLKLRPNLILKRRLVGPLAKIVPLAQTSSYAAADCGRFLWTAP